MIHQQQHRPGPYVHHRLGPKYFIQLSLLHPWLLHCGQCTATAELGVLLLTSSMPRHSASRSRSPTRVDQLATMLQELTLRVNAMDELMKQLVDGRLADNFRRIIALESQRLADSRRIDSRISLLEAQRLSLEESLRRLRVRLHVASEAGPSQTPAGPPPATPALPLTQTPAGPPPARPASSVRPP